MDTTHNDTSPLRRAATIVGAAFLLVGIAGFVPGITTNYDQMTFASHDSGAQLLGIFQVSVLHNLVHLLFGVVGLAMARRTDTARTFLVGGGIVYLALWLYGLAIDPMSDGNFVPVDDADNWLHLGLGLGMLVLGLALPRRTGDTVTSSDRSDSVFPSDPMGGTTSRDKTRRL